MYLQVIIHRIFHIIKTFSPMFKQNTLLFLLCLTGMYSLSAQTELKDYGKKLSVGVSIFQGIGIPVRYYAGSHVLEAGAYMGGIVFSVDNEIKEIRFEPMIGGGYTFFGDRFLKEKKKRSKVRANGISLRVNQILGDYSTTIPSLAWAQETFRVGRTKQSFLFELGIRYVVPHYTYLGLETKSQVGLHLRCQWNFFLK